MNAVDTNVLLYAHDARDARKQATAMSLIQSQAEGDGVIAKSGENPIVAFARVDQIGFGASDDQIRAGKSADRIGGLGAFDVIVD